MPYRNAMDKTYDSGQFESVMDQALALADWNGFDARLADAKRRGRLRGRGMAAFLEWTGADVFEETVTVTIEGDGGIEIFSATQAMGQGLATTYAQLAVDVFGVPIEKIRIVQGDTDRGRDSAAPARARSSSAAPRCRSPPSARSRRPMTSRQRRSKPRPATSNTPRACLPSPAPTGASVFSSSRDVNPANASRSSRRAPSRMPTWPNGCHVCEVEIDPETGAVEIAGYWSVNDVGRVVNPMIVAGQLEGGAVQGIGQALCEGFVYDVETGQALTASFLDYAMPRAEMIRHFATDDGRIDAVPQQSDGREGRGRAGHDRRDAGGGQRGRRRAVACRRRRAGVVAADAAHVREGLARAARLVRYHSRQSQ